VNQALSLRVFRDPKLPAMSVLLGPESRELLGAAVALVDGKVAGARPSHIRWQPGSSLTVVYEAQILRPEQRTATTEYLVATTGDSVPEGAVVLKRGDEQVGVWLQANDPALPGLATALDPRRARALLDQLGVSGGVVKTRLRSYRPLRRAVVEIRSGSLRLFAKLVPPSEARGLQDRHAVFARAIRAPRSLGWSEEHGLVVLEALPGITLREALTSRDRVLPDPGQVAGILEALPRFAGGPVRGPLASVARHSRLLGLLAPELKAALTGFAQRAKEEGLGAAEPVPVHGDFYDAQILTSGGKVSGVLDIDAAGLGARIDDWATMIGHLAVRVGTADAKANRRNRDYARHLLAIAESQADTAELRRRIAAVVLAMATGPFRVQTPNWPGETRRRIRLAIRWLDDAESRPLSQGARAAANELLEPIAENGELAVPA
jgi:hypothetical protein